MSTTSISLPAPLDPVSSWMAAFNQRDLDRMLACIHREVDFRPLKLTGLHRSYRGHDGVRRWFEQIEQLGHDYQLNVESINSVAEGTAVAATGSLRLGGVDLAPFTAIHTIADRQILSARHYLSELNLIERLGLVLHDRPAEQFTTRPPHRSAA